MECRLAEERDAREVVQLWCDLISFYGENFSHYGGEMDPEQLLQSFYHMQRGEAFQILVVQTQYVVATCTLHLNRFSSWSGTQYGTVEDFIVHQDWRGQGLGAALLSYTLERARELGLSRLELHVLSGNLPARALYEKKGFSFNQSYVYSTLFDKEEV